VSHSTPAAIPKVELHVHLRGAMPETLFARQLAKYSPAIALADASERHLGMFRSQPHLAGILAGTGRAADLYRFTSFEGFLFSYFLSSFFFRAPEDFEALVEAVLENFERQGLDAVEVTVSVHEYVMQGIPVEAVCEALSAAAKRKRLRVRWIIDLIRNLGPEQALAQLETLLRLRPDGWVGITIGGSEHLYPPGPFRPAYERARAAGLGLTVHAGEAAGPESVWEAVRELRVDRIGHGVRAIEDPALVDYLADNQVPLEVCLTGNVQTGVYPSLDAHPLPRLVDAGVRVTLNTDDPAFFGVTLEDEFAKAAELGFSDEALDEIRKTAVASAFDRR